MKALFLLLVIAMDCYELHATYGQLCLAENVGYLRHPYDCHKFIRCSHQRAYEFQCPSNLLWHHEIKSCDFSYRTQCKLYEQDDKQKQSKRPINRSTKEKIGARKKSSNSKLKSKRNIDNKQNLATKVEQHIKMAENVIDVSFELQAPSTNQKLKTNSNRKLNETTLKRVNEMNTKYLPNFLTELSLDTATDDGYINVSLNKMSELKSSIENITPNITAPLNFFNLTNPMPTDHFVYGTTVDGKTSQLQLHVEADNTLNLTNMLTVRENKNNSSESNVLDMATNYGTVIKTEFSPSETSSAHLTDFKEYPITHHFTEISKNYNVALTPTQPTNNVLTNNINSIIDFLGFKQQFASVSEISTAAIDSINALNYLSSKTTESSTKFRLNRRVTDSDLTLAKNSVTFTSLNGTKHDSDDLSVALFENKITSASLTDNSAVKTTDLENNDINSTPSHLIDFSQNSTTTNDNDKTSTAFALQVNVYDRSANVTNAMLLEDLKSTNNLLYKQPIPVTENSAYEAIDYKTEAPSNVSTEATSLTVGVRKNSKEPGKSSAESAELRNSARFLTNLSDGQYKSDHREYATPYANYYEYDRTTQDARLPFRALECQGPNNRRQIKAGKCYQYYQCFDGWAFLLNCHDGWRFEGEERKCILDLRRECDSE